MTDTFSWPPETPAELLEERQPGVLLQLAHLCGHRRLRQVQLLGGARKAEVAGDRLEHFQLPQGRVAHRRTISCRECKPSNTFTVIDRPRRLH
jgi:hypothetical protein